MNKQRRKRISGIVSLLEVIKNNLKDVLSDEEMCYDNMPENLQGSVRSETAEESIDVLDDVIDTIDDCIDRLNEII